MKNADTKKFPFLITGTELKHVKVQPSEWVVENLLRIGRRRISLLLGKPESGKSTLARQLAVAVTKGSDFLGRPCKGAPVLYWQCEEDVSHDLKESFDHLGYDADRDEQLYIFDGSTGANKLVNVDKVLTEYPDIKLVIIETLDDLLRIQDLNGNTDARRAFEKFDQQILEKHYHRASFLALHHYKKRETDSVGDQILGATVVRAKTDAKIYLDSKADDSKRFVHTHVRRGVDIPKTYLDYDPKTERSELGLTLAAEYKANAGETGQRIEADILEFFTNHPNTRFEEDCFPRISGNSKTRRQVFNKLVARGRLTKSGKGVKGDAVTYRVAEMTPADRAELNQQLNHQLGAIQ